MHVSLSHHSALTQDGKGFGPCRLFLCGVGRQSEEKGVRETEASLPGLVDEDTGKM